MSDVDEGVEFKRKTLMYLLGDATKQKLEDFAAKKIEEAVTVSRNAKNPNILDVSVDKSKLPWCVA